MKSTRTSYGILCVCVQRRRTEKKSQSEGSLRLGRIKQNRIIYSFALCRILGSAYNSKPINIANAPTIIKILEMIVFVVFVIKLYWGYRDVEIHKTIPIMTLIKPGRVISNKGRRSAITQRIYPSTERPWDAGIAKGQ